MRILIFSWRDIKHPQSGGAEILTLELARRWVQKGHQVSLVSAKFPGSEGEEVIRKVKIFRPAPFFCLSPFQYLRYLYRTIKFYQKNLAGQYDLAIDQVHGLPFFTPFFVKEKVLLFPLEVARKIWFYEVPFPFSFSGYLLEILYIKIFRTLPFLTISPSTAKDLKKLGVKNVFILTPGVTCKPLGRLPRKTPFPLLVSLGRITQMKRIGDTLLAFRLLHKEFPLVKLVVVGRGKEEYLESLRELCRQMAIEDRVSFTGYFPEKEKLRLLRRAWVLVSSTLKEGWGLNVIEAAACGTPTVAYKVAGLVDSIRDQKTGLLCSKNTPVELARNLRKVLLDNTLRKQLAGNALIYSRQFNWEKSAEEVLLFLKSSTPGVA